MALSLEEANKIKDHLLKQLGHLPEDKQVVVKQKLESMPVSEVEKFVEDKKLTHLGGQCLFCSIAHNRMPSVKVAEDKENIAILELNPLSRGHALIVPVTHTDAALPSTEKLSKVVAEKLSKKFSPKEVHIKPLSIMSHAMLEVVPLYGGEKDRHQATEEELLAVQEEFLRPIVELKVEPEKVVVEDKPIVETYYKLPPRIP